ncbi:hypothetical protein VNO78_15038 [Psophocarpus tetragonolobus]|uniref:Uncharacterized protein n=1 Tax=Psophocarpus tetragonolobus TaxID=3891 RepID=A0AAN9SDF0_PSOTE
MCCRRQAGPKEEVRDNLKNSSESTTPRPTLLFFAIVFTSLDDISHILLLTLQRYRSNGLSRKKMYDDSKGWVYLASCTM